MSLYREAGRRNWAAIAAALTLGIFLGALGGFLAARSSEDEATLAEQITALRDRSRPVSSALELVSIEYEPTVRDGRVVAVTEYQAAVDSIARARQSLNQIADDLQALGPNGPAEVRRALDRLAALVEDKAKPSSVDSASRQAEIELRNLLGEPDG